MSTLGTVINRIIACLHEDTQTDAPPSQMLDPVLFTTAHDATTPRAARYRGRRTYTPQVVAAREAATSFPPSPFSASFALSFANAMKFDLALDTHAFVYHADCSTRSSSATFSSSYVPTQSTSRPAFDAERTRVKHAYALAAPRLFGSLLFANLMKLNLTLDALVPVNLVNFITKRSHGARARDHVRNVRPS